MRNRGFGLLGILVVVAIIAIVTSGGFYYSNNTNKTIKSTNEIENILKKAEDAGKQLEEHNKNIIDSMTENNKDEFSVCSSDQRLADVCIDSYQPVCGVVNVQCITAPCNPIMETFSNYCFACKNSLVSSYKEGECIIN